MQFRAILLGGRLLQCLLLVPLMLACQRSNLFESKNDAPLRSPILGPSDETTIALEIRGPASDAYRALIIETNGFMRYSDSLRFAGQYTSALSPEEFGNLVALFLEKDFLHLDDRYENALLPNATRIRIQFHHGGAQKIVTADSVSAPANLQQILARLAQHMLALQNNGLQLTFTSDRDTIAHGEAARLTVTITNPHAHAVTLLAREPMVDFFAFAPYAFAVPSPENPYRAPYLWQTTPHEAEVKVVRTTEWAGGESRVFRTVWRGEDQNGNPLQGNFAVAARLAAIPGGYSAPRTLHIKRK